MRRAFFNCWRTIVVESFIWVLSYVFLLCLFIFLSIYRVDVVKILNLKAISDKEICILEVDKADFDNVLTFQDRFDLQDLHRYCEYGVLGNVIDYPEEVGYGIENVIIISGIYCDILELPVHENDIYCMVSADLDLDKGITTIDGTVVHINGLIPNDFEIITPLYYRQKTDYRFRKCIVLACRDISEIAKLEAFKYLSEIQMCLDGGLISDSEKEKVSELRQELLNQYNVYLRTIDVNDYLIKAYHRDLKTSLSAVIFIIGALVFLGIFIICNMIVFISSRFNVLLLRWLQGERIKRQYAKIGLTVFFVFVPIVLNVFLLEKYIITVSVELVSKTSSVIVICVFFVACYVCICYRKYNMSYFDKPLRNNNGKNRIIEC